MSKRSMQLRSRANEPAPIALSGASSNVSSSAWQSELNSLYRLVPRDVSGRVLWSTTTAGREFLARVRLLRQDGVALAEITGKMSLSAPTLYHALRNLESSSSESSSAEVEKVQYFPTSLLDRIVHDIEVFQQKNPTIEITFTIKVGHGRDGGVPRSFGD